MSDFHLVAYLILRRGDQILLARRSGVTYADGCWGLPGGHVEEDEALADAAARETQEEVGVRVAVEDLTPVGMCRYTEDGAAGLDVFFLAERFDGEPRPVAECDEVAWRAVHDLPQPAVPWLSEALARVVVDGRWFNEMLR